MLGLLFFVIALTLPFHLFAYVPFWEHLRFSKRTTLIFLLTEQLLYVILFFSLLRMGVSIEQAQLIAIPIYGGLFFFFVKMEPGKVTFLYIFTTDYLMIVTAAASFLGNTWFQIPIYTWQSGVLILILFFLTLPFMLHYICRTAGIVFSIHAPDIWKTVWLLPLFCSLIVFLFTYPIKQASFRSFFARVLLMLCMFLIYYHVLQTIQQIQKQTAAEEQAHNMEQLIKIQSNQYALIQSHMEETRRTRHDMRQHWAVLQSCIDKNNFEALAAYIKKNLEVFPPDSHRTFCKNFAVDAILRFYVEKAEQQGIKVEVSFLIEENILIPEPEFCVLLGNLLENALDASPADENAVIHIHAEQKKQDMLLLTVDNTSLQPPKMNGRRFYSCKHDGFGIGTESIRTIAEHYHGDARFEWKDGMFYASVMLNP